MSGHTIPLLPGSQKGTCTYPASARPARSARSVVTQGQAKRVINTCIKKGGKEEAENDPEQPPEGAQPQHNRPQAICTARHGLLLCSRTLFSVPFLAIFPILFVLSFCYVLQSLQLQEAMAMYEDLSLGGKEKCLSFRVTRQSLQAGAIRAWKAKGK